MDNGGEFCSLDFDNYCVDNDIQRVKVVPHTPQQNGVEKRLNRTILEKVWCMLSNESFRKEFWIEVHNTIVYLNNWSLSSSLKFGIQKEEWKGRIVLYSHLWVFRYQAYIHVPKEKRSKMDPKSHTYIFFGYGEDQFLFSLWSLIDKKIIWSRHVVFNEKVLPLSKDESAIKEYIPLFDMIDNSSNSPNCNTQLLYPTNNFSPIRIKPQTKNNNYMQI